MTQRVALRRTVRRRQVRSAARLATLIAIAFILGAPIAWERLPDFGLVYVSHPPTPPKPGDPTFPGIDPSSDIPKVIRPAGAVVKKSGPFKYFDSFSRQGPFVSDCSPLPFVIRRERAPKDGATLVVGALQRLADVSGLSFEFKGYVDKPYKFNGRRRLFSWEDSRQPLWIGWASSDEVPDLGPKTGDRYAVGVGGPITGSGHSGDEIIGGGVVLRTGESLALTFGSGSNEGNVLLHELGHSMGLDHIDSEREQMYPTISDLSPDGYGPGDSAGLQGVRRGCSP